MTSAKQPRSRVLLILLVFSLTGAGLLMARLRNTTSIDTYLGFKAERKLSKLASFGSRPAGQSVYADYHWPARNGGIASRSMGQNSSLPPWSYKLYTQAQLAKLKPEERLSVLKRLSPAEKYDIARNRFDYPLVKQESERTRALSRSTSDLALGWVLSSGFFKEPKAIDYQSPYLPYLIPFSSSDIKALMSYYFQIIGLNDWSVKHMTNANTKSKKSLEAHWVHEVLSNFFLEHKNKKELYAFGVELMQDKNRITRPLLGYSSDIRLLPKGSYQVRTTLKVASLKAPQWEPYGLFNLDHQFINLSYELFTDSRGILTSSKWLSSTQVASLTYANSAPSLDLEFKLLSSLYQPNLTTTAP